MICLLTLVASLDTARAENLYFIPQTNLLGEVSHDWFNGDNWFVYDELGNLMPAGTPARDDQTAVVLGLADAGSNLVRVGGLALTNGAAITNGTFGVSEVVMAPGTSFRNTKVNLLGTLSVTGTGCVLSGSLFHVLSGAVASVSPRSGNAVAELILDQAATLRVDGRLELGGDALLRGGTSPQNKLEVRTIGVLAASGSNRVAGVSATPLLIDHSGVVEVNGAALEFQAGLEWTSTAGVNQFRSLQPADTIAFTGPFQVLPNVTSIFFGPGTNRFASDAVVDGVVRVGASPPGNLEVSGPVSGQGALQILAAGTPGSHLHWRLGTLACARVEVAPLAVMTIAGDDTPVRELDGCALTNAGLCVVTASGLSLQSGSAITNAGEFELRGNVHLLAANGTADGRFENVGTVRKTGAGTASYGDAARNPVSLLELNNHGRVEVAEGTLKVAQGMSRGEFQTLPSATLWFWAGIHTFSSGVRFTGAGKVQVWDAVETPRWRMLGLAQVANLELGARATLEGAGITPTGMLTMGELGIADFATVANAYVSAQAIHFTGGSEFRESVAEVANTLTFTGTAHHLNGSSLALLAGGTGSLHTHATVHLNAGSELNVLGAFELEPAVSILDDAAPSGRVEVHPGGVLRKTGTEAVQFGSATSPGPGLFNRGLVDVTAGELRVGGGASAGEFRLPTGTTLSFWSGTHLWNSGTSFTGAGLVQVGGTAAVVKAQGAVSVPRLALGNNGTLAGTSSLTITESMSWTGGTLEDAGILAVAVPAVLTVEGSGAKTWTSRTLNNAGRIVWNVSGAVTTGNGATWKNLAGSQCEFPGAAVMRDSGVGPRLSLQNAGTLRKTGNGTTAQLEVDLENAGRLELEGGTLAVSGAWRQLAGETMVRAGTTVSCPQMDLLGGVLTGDGNLRAVVNNRALISPGAAVGILTLVETASYRQSPDGTLIVELAGKVPGAQHDQLLISGPAELQGTLELGLRNGFLPIVGDRFTCLTAGSITGAFANITGPTPAGTVWVPRYSPTMVTVALGQPVTLSAPHVSGGNLEFAFQTVAGFSYQVQATEGFSPADWQTISIIPGDGTTKQVIEPIRPGLRFFRVVLE
jgi:hypothetical protein